MSRKEPISKVLLPHLALVILAWPFVTLAQANYPTKPIRFISPYAAGGSTTAMARVVGQKLTYATTGTGGSGHLANEMMNMLAGKVGESHQSREHQARKHLIEKDLKRPYGFTAGI